MCLKSTVAAQKSETSYQKNVPYSYASTCSLLRSLLKCLINRLPCRLKHSLLDNKARPDGQDDFEVLLRFQTYGTPLYLFMYLTFSD